MGKVTNVFFHPPRALTKAESDLRTPLPRLRSRFKLLVKLSGRYGSTIDLHHYTVSGYSGRFVEAVRYKWVNDSSRPVLKKCVVTDSLPRES